MKSVSFPVSRLRPEHQRSGRGRNGPAIPVHLGSKKFERWVRDIAETMQSHQDDTERRIESEQRDPLSSHDSVKDRERNCICEYELAERGMRRHEPKPMMLFKT
jgi:transposase